MTAEFFTRTHPVVESLLPLNGFDSPLKLYWGDLHNHNAVGYARGSLQRSIELAREHLDFFAFTGHAAWHDMPEMPGDRHLKWVRGFEAHSAHWPDTRRMIHQANSSEFAAFLGYEWHSSRFGDYCMIFPDDGELYLPNHVDALLDFADEHAALAIPHHVAYRQGWRGSDWAHYRPGVSPVVEVFSEHGCTMGDRAAFPMLRHSNGGRWTANTIERQLARGLRFGFVASSDDHLGYPGAYGEGVLGVWAEGLSKRALLEALRARRTYAATGDRIALEFRLNGDPMGSEIPWTDHRQIDLRIDSPDSIASVEVIRSGRVLRRHFPEDGPTAVQLPGRARCRIQFGWGPWADLDLGRICDWEMSVRVADGRFLRALPCFQSAPFDEDRRDSLRQVSECELRVQAATSRVAAFAEDPTKSIVVEIEGRRESVLTVELRSPACRSFSTRLGELIENNIVEFTGVFTSESLMIGRLISADECAASLRWTDKRDAGDGKDPDWYYVRVTQHNGHTAWSSPIFVGE